MKSYESQSPDIEPEPKLIRLLIAARFAGEKQRECEIRKELQLLGVVALQFGDELGGAS